MGCSHDKKKVEGRREGGKEGGRDHKIIAGTKSLGRVAVVMYKGDHKDIAGTKPLGRVGCSDV